MADGESLKPIDKLDTEAPMAPMTNTSSYTTNPTTKLTPLPHLTHDRSNSTARANQDYYRHVRARTPLLNPPGDNATLKTKPLGPAAITKIMTRTRQMDGTKADFVNADYAIVRANIVKKLPAEADGKLAKDGILDKVSNELSTAAMNTDFTKDMLGGATYYPAEGNANEYFIIRVPEPTRAATLAIEAFTVRAEGALYRVVIAEVTEVKTTCSDITSVPARHHSSVCTSHMPCDSPS